MDMRPVQWFPKVDLPWRASPLLPVAPRAVTSDDLLDAPISSRPRFFVRMMPRFELRVMPCGPLDDDPRHHG